MTEHMPDFPDGSSPDLENDSSRDLETAERTCQQAGFQTRWLEDPDMAGRSLQIAITNGRYTRWRGITERVAAIIASNDIPPVSALGDYDAFLYKDTSEIEARLRMISPFARAESSLSRLPGVLKDEPDVELLSEDDHEEAVVFQGKWRLPLSANAGQKWSAEIGSASDRFGIFVSWFRSDNETTLKIRDATRSLQHDDALRVLEEIGEAILFEIDLRYDLPVILSTIPLFERNRRVDANGKPPTRPRRRRIVSDEIPHLPRNSYPSKPLSLYRYARSANNLPLLQYLAYYQVLEYHFSTYYQRETLDRLKQELLDPRFSPQNDANLSRLISIATSNSKGFGAEREQLRATVRACVALTSLDEYLGEAARREFFEGKQPIKGVPRIVQKNASTDLRDQASDRIYDIRCRIVHTKSDSQDLYPELILPFSEEANALTLDIDLIQYLAQRVLINRAQPLRFS